MARGINSFVSHPILDVFRRTQKEKERRVYDTIQRNYFICGMISRCVATLKTLLSVVDSYLIAVHFLENASSVGGGSKSMKVSHVALL